MLIEVVALDKDYFEKNNIKINLYGADYKGGVSIRYFYSGFSMGRMFRLYPLFTSHPHNTTTNT